MARSRTKPTAVPVPAALPTAPAPPTEARTLSSEDPVLPLALYLPRVPLQLFAVAFILVAASTPQGKHLPAPQRVVAQLVLDPLMFLPIVCAALALLQTWFGYWARSCRTKDLERRRTGSAAPAPQPKASTTAPKRTFKASLKVMWDGALKGEAPATALWKKRAQTQGTGPIQPAIDISFVSEAVMVTLLATVALHACAVLLGAPLTVNTPSTFLLSLLISILAFLPLGIALSPSGTTERYVWLRLFSTLSPNDDLELALLAPAVGTLVGAWCGAIPIPLDWDRPWQRWPTTPVLGALAGHALGSLVALAKVAYRGVVRTAVDVLKEADQQQQQDKVKTR